MRRKEVEQNTRKRRKNGCACPFHLMQWAAYLGYVLNVGTFYFIVIHLITDSNEGKWILAAGYAVLVIFLLTLKIWCTLSDPTDPVYYENLSQIRQGLNILALPGQLYCENCDSYANGTSKHWNRWNRWVNGFDHHWKWLNNCVGKKNYRLFVILLATVIITWIVNMPIYTIAIIRRFDDADDKLRDVYGSSTDESDDGVQASILYWMLILAINIII